MKYYGSTGPTREDGCQGGLYDNNAAASHAILPNGTANVPAQGTIEHAVTTPATKGREGWELGVVRRFDNKGAPIE